MVARTHPFARMRLAGFLLLVLAFSGSAAPKKPKLVVLLVVDQMRADYITDYGHTWTQGLHRLVNDGAFFTEAAYPYLKTVTCAGHATISTGTFPSTHGMILNAWYDRKSGKMLNCTDDDRMRPVAYGQPLNGMGASAWMLKAETFADTMVSQDPYKKARVISFSMKARSAVMLGGHKADAVTWFDTGKGEWVTSRAYTLNPIPFITRFIQKNPVERDFGRVWDHAMPVANYKYADEDPLEKPNGWSTAFPHVVNGSGKQDSAFFSQWRDSPFADDYLGAMAMDAVEQLKLGQKDRTDVLAVSFSALDAVGHDFGPRSHEVQDVLYRLDATIGKLLAYLDKQLGANNYVVALSADHGVATIPEHLKAEGIDAGRVNGADVQRVAEAFLQERLGPGKYVARSTYTDLYFEKGVEARIEADLALETGLKNALLGIPGVGWVYSSADLKGKKDSADPMERAAALSFFEDRSGDWTIVPKLYWYFRAADATTHGTAHWYDTHVPVIFFGYGIRAGRYSTAATPADIAPTLAHLLGFILRHAEGHPLEQALAADHAHADSPHQ